MSRDYTVRPGDTLGHIAMRELGNALQWPLIAEMNGLYDWPRNPDLIHPGEVLKLPS